MWYRIKRTQTGRLHTVYYMVIPPEDTPFLCGGFTGKYNKNNKKSTCNNIILYVHVVLRTRYHPREHGNNVNPRVCNGKQCYVI